MPRRKLTSSKKQMFLAGFALLRRMARGPISRDEAVREGVCLSYRDWYRWLRVFTDCEIPLAEDYRFAKGRQPEKTMRLWPQDWKRLIGAEKKIATKKTHR